MDLLVISSALLENGFMINQVAHVRPVLHSSERREKSLMLSWTLIMSFLLLGAPECGSFTSCNDCASSTWCAWCAAKAKCMVLEDTYYEECNGVVYDPPCPASFVPGKRNHILELITYLTILESPRDLWESYCEARSFLWRRSISSDRSCHSPLTLPLPLPFLTRYIPPKAKMD